MIYLLINHTILFYNGYYKIINSANIKKTKPISEKLRANLVHSNRFQFRTVCQTIHLLHKTVFKPVRNHNRFFSFVFNKLKLVSETDQTASWCSFSCLFSTVILKSARQDKLKKKIKCENTCIKYKIHYTLLH